MGSTRLNAKALELIEGLPMVAHVYFRAKLASHLAAVYVCTDSAAIENACKKYSIPCIMTGDFHLNGTERCGEAAFVLGLGDDDIVIDIQGDEPLINPVHIDLVCAAAKNSDAQIILPHLEINDANVNIVKVVSSDLSSEVLYLSRANIPYQFRGSTYLKKHLSIIAFSMGALKIYCNSKPTPLEIMEGIELLRALEIGLRIKTIKLDGESRAVDIIDDLLYVRKVMRGDPWYRVYKKLSSNE